MATNHTTSIAIPFGANTQGFFSFGQAKTLVIFVHGFGGGALSTWNNFPSLILFDDKYKSADVIFYGYDTFKGQAGDHATDLYHFLNAAVISEPIGILPDNQGLAPRNYERVILVAHSLGAVLARQAQILAYIAGKDWVNLSELALFAPAHHGAKVISLVMEALPGLSGLLGIFTKFRFPILNDLDAEDDGILRAIKNQTETLQGQGKGDFTKAKLVVYAQNDKVVRSYQYLYDTPATVLPGESHVSVCKPKSTQAKCCTLLNQIL